MTDEDIVRKFKSLYCGVCYFQVCSECRYKSPFMKGYRCAEKDLLPVWHDLRKNPNDLPEILHPVYAKLDSGIYVFAYCVNEIWHRNDDGVILYHGNGECEVIAWCEIPRYTEGE